MRRAHAAAAIGTATAAGERTDADVDDPHRMQPVRDDTLHELIAPTHELHRPWQDHPARRAFGCIWISGARSGARSRRAYRRRADASWRPLARRRSVLEPEADRRR